MKQLYPVTDLPQRNTGLDIMRTVALFMVFWAHSLHLFLLLVPQLAHLSHFTRNGVELFFFLSGFLIGNIMIRNFTETEKPVHVLFWFYLVFPMLVILILSVSQRKNKLLRSMVRLSVFYIGIVTFIRYYEYENGLALILRTYFEKPIMDAAMPAPLPNRLS